MSANWQQEPSPALESAYSKRQRLGAGDGQQDFSIVVRGMGSGFNRFDL